MEKSVNIRAKTSESSSKGLKKITITVENIVASVDIKTRIDIQALLEKYKDIEKKENFPGVIVKLTRPKGTILIFSSGKLVITGVKLLKYISIIVEKTTRKLKEIGTQISEQPEVTIQNIVCRADFGCGINLDMTSLSLDSAIYEPEIFPGLIYKVSQPEKVCFLIFSSGKIIITGAKNIEVVKRATKKLAVSLKQMNLLGDTHELGDANLDLDVSEFI